MLPAMVMLFVLFSGNGIACMDLYQVKSPRNPAITAAMLPAMVMLFVLFSGNGIACMDLYAYI
jgi:hypothetical protein